MDLSLLIFIIVVGYFAYRGYRNGLLKSTSRVLSLVAGYACAILFTGDMTPVVEAQLGLEGIIALITASLILFFGAGFIVGVLFWISAKLLFDDKERSTGSNLGGAAIGTVVGVLFAIVIVWALAFARDMSIASKQATTSIEEPSQIESLANKVASTALSTALSMGPAEPEVARLSAALLESPAEITARGQRLMESPDLQNLLRNPNNQRVLNSGNAAAVQKLPAFQALVQNPDMLAIAASAGLQEEAEKNGLTMEAELARQFTDIWGRTQRVKNNPRVQEIINDPAFQARVMSGNPMQLLNSSELLELSDIIFSDEAAPPVDTASTTDQGQSEVQKKEPKKLYKWTDSSGRIYYSDKKPDS